MFSHVFCFFLFSERPVRTTSEVEAAFDEIQMMLHKVAASLDDTFVS